MPAEAAPTPALDPTILVPEAVQPVMQESFSESSTALLGLRRAINIFRLERTEAKLSKADVTNVTSQSNAQRIFADVLPEVGHYPVTRRQEAKNRRNARRRNKIVKATVMQESRAVYGSTDGQSRPFFAEDRPEYEVIEVDHTVSPPDIAEGMPRPTAEESGSRNKLVVAVKEKRPPYPNDLGTIRQERRLASGQYSSARKRAERKEAREFKHHRDSIIEKRTKIDNEIYGDDTKRKRTRLSNKKSSLQRRQQLLDDAEQQRARSKRALNAAKKVNEAHDRPQIQRPIERVTYMAEPRHAVSRKLEGGRIAWHNAMAERAAKRADKISSAARDDDEFAQYDAEQSRITSKGYRSRAQKAKKRQQQLKTKKERVDVTGWI